MQYKLVLYDCIFLELFPCRKGVFTWTKHYDMNIKMMMVWFNEPSVSERFQGDREYGAMGSRLLASSHHIYLNSLLSFFLEMCGAFCVAEEKMVAVRIL